VFEIVFWQRIVSPHMACLARELADIGSNVFYIVERPMSEDRQRQGWQAPDLGLAGLKIVGETGDYLQLLSECSDQAIHLVQGIRGNGGLSVVVRELCAKKARWGVIMETVQETPLRGMVKRLTYRYLLKKYAPDFILGIGHKTSSWVAARGYPKNKIYPFTYFLEQIHSASTAVPETADSTFRVGFVGQLIEGKRLDVLIYALSQMDQVELLVVGDGPLRGRLQKQSEMQIPHIKSQWFGQIPMGQARQIIATLDCLVLPSDHDGWGAVVSEALMAGVPAICSDACGAAAVVYASGVGGVFARGDAEGLRNELNKARQNRLDFIERKKLSDWAQCVSASAGAKYLVGVFDDVYHSGATALPPWQTSFKSTQVGTLS